MQLRSWILAARPKTLTAALIPVLVGTALAFGLQGGVRPELSLLALLSAVLIQIGTNLINDALDFKKGADTAERIGPKRVTQSGIFKPDQVWWAGIFCFVGAALLGLPLVMAGGWPIVAIGIFSLLAGYAYTGGPYPLAYLGLGDLFVLVFFGWVAVGGVYYLNTGAMDLAGFVAGTQVGLLATVLIAINNLRDAKTDIKAAKKTLPVRFGSRFARMEITLLCLIPFFSGIYWMQTGLKWAFALPFFVLPVAIQLVRKVFSTEPSEVYNRYLAQAAAIQLCFGVLLSLGFYLR